MTFRLMAPNIALVPCERSKEDARLIMDWRNDPETLAASFHPKPKAWRTFWPEFQSTYFPDGDCPGPVIVHNVGRAIGYLRFRPLEQRNDLAQPACDISITLDRLMRGRGLGREVLIRAQTYLKTKNLRTVLAEVRADNVPSRRVFQKAGFDTLGLADRLVRDTGEICRVESFIARLEQNST